MPSVDELAAAVDTASLTPIVRGALGSDAAELAEWQYSPIPYVNARQGYQGLYRYSGTAADSGEERPWSVVLKLMRRLPRTPDDPSYPGYWKREELAYGSGLLDDLPGLSAPRCFGATETHDETAWLWLEDIEDDYDRRWPLERYGLAARHLGQFNGAYVTDRVLPSHDWLNPTRSVATSGQGDAVGEMLRRPATWQHPIVRRVFPEPIAERALVQREDRRAFRAAASQLPRTLCHYDMGAQNLMARRRDGRDETVAIDWELMGIGPLTTDTGYLVIQTLRRFAVGIADAARLEELVLDGYVAGLRDSGWTGDPGAIRLGYLACVALRLGLIPSILNFIFDESQRETVERVWSRSLEEVVERWGELAYFVLDRADEARRLLRES